MDMILQPGDLLYMPRGTIHQGNCLEDTHSLHITVSCHQLNTYGDLLEKLLPMALKVCIFFYAIVLSSGSARKFENVYIDQKYLPNFKSIHFWRIIWIFSICIKKYNFKMYFWLLGIF